jgi:hypothetical protein
MGPDYNTYINLQPIANLATVEKDLLSFFVIMAFVRSLKFLKIPPYTGPGTKYLFLNNFVSCNFYNPNYDG